jgi:hypothetical protein
MASAQDYGSITGSISSYGNNPHPINGVTITASNEFNSYSSTSGINGVYMIDPVETGTYTLSVEKEGFISQTVENVEVGSQQVVIVDFNLMEFPFPPPPVIATLNEDHTEILVTWYNVDNDPGIIHADGSQHSPKTRDFVSYKIYILLQGEEQNPENWTLLDSTLASSEYIDTQWPTYHQGWYRYAVISKYTYNQSEPVFSNPLPNIMNWDVTIVIRGCENEPLPGALVIICNESTGDCDSLYTNQGGGVGYNLSGGYFSIEIIYDDYPPFFLNHIVIFGNITIHVVLCPACLPPQVFQVNGEGEATWYPPAMDDEISFHEGFESGSIPFGWSQEFVSGEIPWTVYQGNPSGIPATACQGIYNAAFYGDSGETMLITPELDLHGAIDPRVIFYYVQPAGTSQNVLKVWYRTSPQSMWHPLAAYISGDSTWIKKVLDLPEPGSRYQIGFLGKATQPGGMGVCVDSVVVKKARYPYVNTDPDLEDYDVYLNGVSQDTTCESHYTFEGLVPGSFNVAGIQARYTYCTSIITQYPFYYFPCELLGQPNNFMGTIEGLTVTLSWEPPTGYGDVKTVPVKDSTYTLVGYNVYRNNQLVNEEPINGLQYSEEVVPDGDYYYNVTAVYQTDNKPYAESCFIDPSYEVIVCCIFAAPEGLVADVLNFNDVFLTWHPPDTTEVPKNLNRNTGSGGNRYVMTGYNVWRDEWRIGFIPPTDTDYLDMYVSPGIHVYYVSAVYDEGESYKSLGATVEIFARGNMKGFVRDGMTWDAIPGATIMLNPSGLTASTDENGFFLFENIPVGDYEVTAQADGYNQTVLDQIKVNENKFTMLNIPVYTGNMAIFPLPFTETWYEGNFESHAWSFSSPAGNWVIDGSEGNPPPSASFSYVPVTAYFESSLLSPVFDARMASDFVWLYFDIAREDPGAGNQESMRIEIWGDTSWMTVDEINSEGSFNWQPKSYVISDYAKGKLFKLRFTATGDDSYPVSHWGIDNVRLYESSQALLEGIVTELAGGNPVNGVTVTVTGYPPSTSDAAGYYAIHADEGTYTVTCEAPGYNPVTQELNISGITTWDVQLTQPVMTVDPQSLYQEYDPLTSDTTVFSQSIVIHNDGNGPLEWTTLIEYLDASGKPVETAEDSWLSLDTDQGTVEPGNQQEVTATFNAQGLSGDYSYMASITFSSSPDVGTVIIMATFDVASGISKITVNDRIEIYPNPSKDMITINSMEKIKSLRIMNYPGQMVYSMTVSTGNKFNISTSGFSNGTYLIEFEMEDGHTMTSKIVVDH